MSRSQKQIIPRRRAPVRTAGRGEEAIHKVMRRLQSLFDDETFGPVTANWLNKIITERIEYLDEEESKMKKKMAAAKDKKQIAADKKRKAYRKKHEYKGPKPISSICPGPAIRCPGYWCNATTGRFEC